MGLIVKEIYSELLLLAVAILLFLFNMNQINALFIFIVLVFLYSKINVIRVDSLGDSLESIHNDVRLDVMYLICRDALMSGKFEVVDFLLKKYEQESNLVVLLGVLTITLGAKDKLKNRICVLHKVKMLCEEKRLVFEEVIEGLV